MKPSMLFLTVLNWTLTQNFAAEWAKFATSVQYSNTRLVTELKDFFLTKLIQKGGSVMAAKMECSAACARNESCMAFNFFETEPFYTCELLPENFCSNKIRKVLVLRNGSSLWERLTGNQNQSCVDQKYPNGNISCAFLQSGCFGMWPNCYNCFNSCLDCMARGNFVGQYLCTFWPENNIPVFGSCSRSATFLFCRVSQPTPNRIQSDYRVPFGDIYRLYKLKVYPKLELWFGAMDDTWYTAIYTNWIIDENGTLLGNLTFVSGVNIPNDPLNVTGRPVLKMPFVQVDDDRFGCGSFWLLDTDNSTYCPGGKTGMFGRLIKDGTGKVQSTGIKLANVNKIFWFGSVELSL